MKIGIDARLYRSSTAGIGRYSQNLIKNLLEIDHENQYVLFMTPEDERELKAQSEKLKARRNNVKIITTNIGHYSIEEQLNLAKIIEKEKCDLVHFINFNVPVNFKGKYVVTIHDLTLFFYPGRSKKSLFHKLAYKYIFQKACSNSAKIIAVSESTKKDILKMFGTDPKKIEVIYEAADDKTFLSPTEQSINEIKSKFGFDCPVILYVGQWRSHKNLLSLIESFNMVRREISCKLVLVGKPDLAYPEVRVAIDKSPFLKDIIIPGFVTENELATWYKIAHVFVFPSFYEGFGLPGLEAMMAGTAVISSDRTSLPEIYKDAAIYFNPDSPKDMAEKIKEVIEDEGLRKSLIQKGQEVVKSYSWRKTALETLEVYRKI